MQVYMRGDHTRNTGGCIQFFDSTGKNAEFPYLLHFLKKSHC